VIISPKADFSRGRHFNVLPAHPAAGDGRGEGTVAMFCVVIDPNSWRSQASPAHSLRHNQPRAGLASSSSALDERMTINHHQQ